MLNNYIAAYKNGCEFRFTQKKAWNYAVSASQWIFMNIRDLCPAERQRMFSWKKDICVMNANVQR